MPPIPGPEYKIPEVCTGTCFDTRVYPTIFGGPTVLVPEPVPLDMHPYPTSSGKIIYPNTRIPDPLATEYPSIPEYLTARNLTAGKDQKVGIVLTLTSFRPFYSFSPASLRVFVQNLTPPTQVSDSIYPSRMIHIRVPEYRTRIICTDLCKNKSAFQN